MPSPSSVPEVSHLAQAEAFFGRPAPVVAPELLGTTLTGGGVTVRLTEVEAYSGEFDAASHAFRGPTARNEVMFGPPGRVYVYFIYGMHWAVNLVCETDGVASAVLLRAGEVVAGEEHARVRRGTIPQRQLARGPGNLASALGAKGEMTGTTVWDGPLRWAAASSAGRALTRVEVGPRVGISTAADIPWRFWLADEATVSAYRRHQRRRR
jgi:DNA-3-methyladenine glycosylase